MKRLAFVACAVALALSAAAPPATADPASDVFSFLQKASLADVQQAEAIYAANPNVPTAAAATQCLGWAAGVLAATPAGTGAFSVYVPQGAVSAIADIDVALSAAGSGPPAIVEQFNKNCGWYAEDLKAEALAHAGGAGFRFLGIKF